MTTPASSTTELSEESLKGLKKLENQGISLDQIYVSAVELSFQEPVVKLDNEHNVVALNFGSKRLKNIDITAFEHFPHLQTLNLGGTDLPLPELLSIVNKIANSIQYLFLGGNGLRDAGVMALVQFLPTATQLIKLDLRYNDIGPAGVQALQALPATLRFLYLEGNQLQDDGAVALAVILASSNVQEVFLGSNQIGPVGANALAQMLPNSQITILYLEGNHIGQEGAEHFIRVLEDERSNIKLQHLYVDNNRIGKESSKRLATALNLDTVIEDATWGQ